MDQLGADLPIREALPVLVAALRRGNTAVLVAPPGAGKTTVVPLALLNEDWVGGRRLIVLEPRRLAARAAATRMAATLDEPVGRTIGFRVRGESRMSAATRVEVVTEGVFTRMILADPGLEGVAAVLFDEFHERSLDADLGLAFARDAQTVLRDDLRLLVMSATLDGARVSALLGGAPVIRSDGRAFPVATLHLGREPERRVEEACARAIRRALDAEEGSVLVFLPGAGEIRRTETLLQQAFEDRPDVLIAPLYGALEPDAQERALSPPPLGMRKVVLATSIAQTSLTIHGVRVVIDSGLARVPRYDPARGLTRLATVRVSRASADQRRGRAGRTEPGVCYRLWDEAETRALPAFDRPEILESDLSGVALDLAVWGASSPAGLALLDAPPAASFAEARRLLQRLGALDGSGALTSHGRSLSDLPLPPRLGHMVMEAGRRGGALEAARIAALLTERGVGGPSTDLRDRLQRLEREPGRRAEQARALADRWARLAAQSGAEPGRTEAAGQMLALAYPERVARTRREPGHFLLAGGRGALLDPADALARSDWLAVGELGGGGARDRILLAAPLEEADVLDLFADQLVAEQRVEVDERGRVRARLVRRLGAIEIDAKLAPAKPEERRRALLAWIADRGLASLPFGAGARALRSRTAFLRSHAAKDWPDLGDADLLETLGAWAGPLLEQAEAVEAIPPAALEEALWELVGRERRRELDRLAPERFATPAGTSHVIDYAAEAGPRVEVRVQELFGLAEHPMVAGGRVPLTLALLSPAHRPVQLTRDLPGFWAGSWKAVRSEMRGRYPKHPWPEDPLAAPPTTRAKPRGS